MFRMRYLPNARKQMTNLACLIKGHQRCNMFFEGDYRTCKGCVKYKQFYGKDSIDFLILGHCKFCKKRVDSAPYVGLTWKK